MWIFLVICIIICFYKIGYSDMIVRTYHISSSLIHNEVKIGVITDLHGTVYGFHQQQLIQTIQQQNPDIIVFVGDIVDEHSDMIGIEDLLKGIQDYCCYYVLGNHEFSSNKQNEIISLMKAYGVHVLRQHNEMMMIKDTSLIIGGIDDLFLKGEDHSYEEKLEDFTCRLQQMSHNVHQDVYSILLSHRPSLVKLYQETPYDLVVSGHAHGGQWRIPYILNGLFAPDELFFPRYAGGQYQFNQTTLIVSRGLVKNLIPRFFNPPELVMIQLMPQDKK